MMNKSISPSAISFILILCGNLFARDSQTINYSFIQGMMAGLTSVAIVISIILLKTKNRNNTKMRETFYNDHCKNSVYLAIAMLTTLTSFVLIRHLKDNSTAVFVLLPIIGVSILANCIYLRRAGKILKGRPTE